MIEEVQESDGRFDEDKTIVAQLPFFTCPNHFYDKELSRDIQRYTYCNDNNVAPYPGTYGDQPARWVKRFTAIKSAFAKKESMMISKSRKDIKAKHGK